MTDDPGFRPETLSTYEPTADEVAARVRSPVDDALDRLERCIDWREGRGRERAAEALATVREALERLRRHPDAWSQEAFDQQKARAEAAEAEVERLREGLREIADYKKHIHVGADQLNYVSADTVWIARALLAGSAGEHAEGEGGET